MQRSAIALTRVANSHAKDQSLFTAPMVQQLVSVENEQGRHIDSSGLGTEAYLRGDGRRIQEAPSPAGLGAPTPAPTLGVICNICGDDTMEVTSGLSTTLADGQVFPCTDVETAGLLQYYSETACAYAQLLAASDCGCVPVQGSNPAPSPIASIPSSGLNAPTPAPTLGVVCLVCGDETMQVTAGLTTTLLDGSEYSCTDVEAAGKLQLFGETSCEYAKLEATSDCGCVPTDSVGSPSPSPSSAVAPTQGSELMSPSPSPVVAPTQPTSPVASPDGNGSEMQARDVNADGGPVYLVALLVIPVIAVIVYLIVRGKKSNDGPNGNKPSSNFAAPLENVDEASNPPAASGFPHNHNHNHAPYSQQNETIPSVTASSLSNEEYHDGNVRANVATAASHSSGGDGWSASGTDQSYGADHHHQSIGEASAGSSSNRTPIPYVSAAPSPVSNTGGYMPTNKDQCRTVVSAEEVLAVAVAVDDDITVQSEAVSERRRPAIDP